MKEKKQGIYALGEKIYKMRKARRMTQMQLADAVGIDARRISCYENGREEMGALTFDRILNVLLPGRDPQTDEMLCLWESMSEGNKALLMEMMKKLGQGQKNNKAK